MKHKRLIVLCDMHDEIKNNPIRLAGLIEEEGKLPYNAKDLYYQSLLTFVNRTIKYIEDFKNEEHVIKALNNSKKYDYKKIKTDLEICQTKYEDLLSFIASTDFKVFSPLHYIIEHLYFYLNNEYRTKSFQNRMK